MDHKAYAFNWPRFEKELSAILFRALQTERPDDELIGFIDTNLGELSNPYEGGPLDELWRRDLIHSDAHELGDIALTRYYDVWNVKGVPNWMDLSETLPKEAQLALLGEPFGNEGFYFDPGKMGSYFQTPAQTMASLAILRQLNHAELNGFQMLLENSCRAGWGLYVTF